MCGVKSLKETKPWSNPIMPILYVFNVLGRVPFGTERSGTLQFHLVSFPMLWALVLSTAQVGFALIFYWQRISQGKYWASFDKILNSLDKMVALSSAFHGPLFTWRDTTAIVQAVNHWNRFHITFQETLKKPVSSIILQYNYLGVIPIVITAFPFLISTFTGKPEVTDIATSLIFALCTIYVTLYVYFWFVYCCMVKRFADLLRQYLSERTTNHFRSPQDFIAFRKLWAQFQDCVFGFTDAFAITLHAYICAIFFTLLLSIYGVCMFSFVDRHLDIGATPFAVFHGSFSLWTVFSMSHIAQKSMRDDLLLEILSHRWQHLSVAAKTELELLLDLIDMGRPSFDMRGVFVVNRLQLIPIVCSIGTYLVVLTQLKISTTPDT